MVINRLGSKVCSGSVNQRACWKSKGDERNDPKQDKRNVRLTSKSRKRFDERGLEEIIGSALSELSSQSSEASRYLISLAKNSSLEKHQTRRNIAEMAEELLRKLWRGNDNAN